MAVSAAGTAVWPHQEQRQHEEFEVINLLASGNHGKAGTVRTLTNSAMLNSERIADPMFELSSLGYQFVAPLTIDEQ